MVVLGGYSLYIDGMLSHPVCRQRRFSSRSSSLKCKSPSGDYYCEGGTTQNTVYSLYLIWYSCSLLDGNYRKNCRNFHNAAQKKKFHRRNAKSCEMDEFQTWNGCTYMCCMGEFVSFSRSFPLKLSKTLQYTNTFKGMPNSSSVWIHHPLGFSWHPDLKVFCYRHT